jgi:hypothetical protein
MKLLTVLGVATALTWGAVSHANAASRSAQAVALQGTLHATETRVFSNPDTGASLVFQGHGQVQPLGSVHDKGTERGVGFVAQGHASAVVTLTNAQGSLTLHIVYATTPGFAPIPKNGTYHITKGTGAYQGATGSGPVTRKTAACPTSVAGSCAYKVTFSFHPSAKK